jgi:streptomycin 6-kinase
MPHPPNWIWPPARRLDAIAAEVAAEWKIALGPRFSGARYSFAAPANGAVLKIRPPEDDESDHEPDALRFWNGDGAVRLLREDPVRRAILIERAVPGYDAASLDREEAIQVAMDVGRRIWRRGAGSPFRTASAEVRRWLANVESTGHPFAPIAKETFERMRPADDVLVHGDYHHHNLLRDGDSWVAIDPKPLLSEPEFDVVTLLWNPIGHAPTRESTEARIRLLAREGLDEARIREWAIVRGTYLGLPLDPGESWSDVPQLQVVAALVG